MDPLYYEYKIVQYFISNVEFDHGVGTEKAGSRSDLQFGAGICRTGLQEGQNIESGVHSGKETAAVICHMV